MRFTLNQLIALVIKAKRTGNGKIGNGRLLVMLLAVITDCDRKDISAERTVLRCFSDTVNKNDAYHAIDRKISAITRFGQPYPYEELRFNAFEAAIQDHVKHAHYLKKMYDVCNMIFDPNLVDSFVYTILQAIKHDASMHSVLYGNQYIKKSILTGSPAHPVRICLPALLLGLLYQLHSIPPERSENTQLLTPPPCRLFALVSLSPTSLQNVGELLDLLIPNYPQTTADAIILNAPYMNPDVSYSRNYPIDFEVESQTVSQIPDTGNVYLYGNAASGKTTYLQQYAHKNVSQVTLYLPLYHYKNEIHPTYHPENSCWTLLQILLKYRFQNAYQTYEICATHETDSEMLTALFELDSLFSETTIQNAPQFCLILDGINEISSKSYLSAIHEIYSIMMRWKNVRFIISGRSTPSKILHGFQIVKLCGVQESVYFQLSDETSHSDISDLLKNPLMLNFYQSVGSTLQTKTEFLEAYFDNWLTHFHSALQSGMMSVRFLLNLAIPYIAYTMAHNRRYEIDRAGLCEGIKKAVSFYLENDKVYHNFTLFQDIRREDQFSISQYTDTAINHLSIMITDENFPHLLHFSHPCYRDYFAAKHIVTIINALDSAFGLNNPDELEKQIWAHNLHEKWFSENDTEIYKIVGEISAKANSGAYLPDLLLDWARLTDSFRLTENVISTVDAVNNHVICDLKLYDIQLPLWIPAYIKFSDHGERSCIFISCQTGFFGLFDAEIFAKYSPDRTHIYLHWSEDCYTVEFDLSDYLMTAEFYHDDAFEGVPIAEVDEKIVHGIFRNLPHFRNCEFENTKFWDENSRAKKWLLSY